MSFEYTIYGDVVFDLSYTDEEMSDRILKYISLNKKDGYFTYHRLCRFIITLALAEDRLVGADKNVYYQSPQLDPSQYTRVSKILWRHILDGKIFIDFYNNEYVTNIPNDTRFGINQDNV